MLFHSIKTLALTGSVLQDARVHPARKAVFLTAMGVLIAAALGVEGAAELVNAIPFVGQFIGLGELPVDAVVDWVVVSVAAFNLLKLFPANVVGEHYDRIFRSRKATSEATGEV
jgi:riboflavin transporter FmnP